MNEGDPVTIPALERAGYRHVKVFPDGKFGGVMQQLFTAGLFVGLDSYGYARRYCYERFEDAANALATWDGVGDPPGPWVKEKPSDRLGPGATNAA